ncbi:hypothetical protein QBC38DRAFT_10387 [Podospora fimiseda]|uniref:RRM domain-containing protein n=1 Tax=Podospora fimiseda TaxID=252190 RepID=A0AAN7H389_9PEZI|nr:hypothetical protein QBC38DRAFT_10387 [Podospora fimiseda]
MPRSKRNENPDLRTVQVPPGYQTGLYYITIANLDYATKWEDLKELASKVCEVDHVEVYNPTSACVRLKGLDNFQKCLNHLNGNTLHSRTLQADGRNSHSPTVVKLKYTDFHANAILNGQSIQTNYSIQPPQKKHDSSVGYSQSSTQGSYGAAAGAFTSSSQPYQTYSNQAPTYSTEGYGGYNMSNPAAAPSYYPATSSGQQLMYQQGMSTQTAQAAPADSMNTTYYQAAAGPSSQSYSTAPPGTVIFDYRKIVIFGLDRNTINETTVRDLLKTVGQIPTENSPIEKVEIEINQNEKPRGSAYVTFVDADWANYTIKCLHKQEVGKGGQPLRVRHAVEGVSRQDTFEGEQQGERRPKKERKQRQGGAGGSGSGQQGGGGGGSSAGVVEERPPAIVDGTLTKRENRRYL